MLSPAFQFVFGLNVFTVYTQAYCPIYIIDIEQIQAGTHAVLITFRALIHISDFGWGLCRCATYTRQRPHFAQLLLGIFPRMYARTIARPHFIL